MIPEYTVSERRRPQNVWLSLSKNQILYGKINLIILFHTPYDMLLVPCSECHPVSVQWVSCLQLLPHILCARVSSLFYVNMLYNKSSVYALRRRRRCDRSVQLIKPQRRQNELLATETVSGRKSFNAKKRERSYHFWCVDLPLHRQQRH
jgi:hypothetical protein